MKQKINIIKEVKYGFSRENKIVNTIKTQEVTSWDFPAYVAYQMRCYIEMGYDVKSNIINNENIIAITKTHKIFPPTTILYILENTIEY